MQGQMCTSPIVLVQLPCTVLLPRAKTSAASCCWRNWRMPTAAAKMARLLCISPAFQSVLGPAEALLNAKADVNATDQFGHTPLVFAVREGHVEVAKLLLQHQADVNSSSLDGAVPLHVAAERGHATLLRVLLRMRADVHAKGCDGLTALDILAIEGNKERSSCMYSANSQGQRSGKLKSFSGEHSLWNHAC